MRPRWARPFVKPGWPFRPTNILNLANWWDADDLSTITIATGVSSWVDKQQGVDVFQATTTKQPVYATGVAALNNRAVIQFDGVDDTLKSTATLDYSNAEETLFVVGKFPAAASVKYIMQKVAGDIGEFSFFRNTNGNFRRGNTTDGGGAITNWTWDTTAYHILVIRRKLDDGAAALGVWEGGGGSTKTTTHTVASTETGAIAFGASAGGGTPYDCELAEIIRYTRKLTFAEINSLCLNYLVRRWAGEPSWTAMAA